MVQERRRELDSVSAVALNEVKDGADRGGHQHRRGARLQPRAAELGGAVLRAAGSTSPRRCWPSWTSACPTSRCPRPPTEADGRRALLSAGGAVRARRRSRPWPRRAWSAAIPARDHRRRRRSSAPAAIRSRSSTMPGTSTRPRATRAAACLIRPRACRPAAGRRRAAADRRALPRLRAGRGGVLSGRRGARPGPPAGRGDRGRRDDRPRRDPRRSGCRVAAGAVIEAGAEIGARCRIGANAVIGAGVALGAGLPDRPRRHPQPLPARRPGGDPRRRCASARTASASRSAPTATSRCRSSAGW